MDVGGDYEIAEIEGGVTSEVYGVCAEADVPGWGVKTLYDASG